MKKICTENNRNSLIMSVLKIETFTGTTQIKQMKQTNNKKKQIPQRFYK